jgi:subtilase family serine protease
MEATVPMEVAPVDLVVTDISDSLPSQLTESDSVTTRVTVRNQGSGAIRKPFQVALYVNNRWVNAVRLNGLEAGESKTVALTWTAFTAETITITAVADPDNQVPGEVDETNNGLSRQFNVRVVPSQQVRLSLSPITQKVAAGGQVNYQVQLNNSTKEPRRFRLQVVGLNGLQATISPDASLLNAWDGHNTTCKSKFPPTLRLRPSTSKFKRWLKTTPLQRRRRVFWRSPATHKSSLCCQKVGRRREAQRLFLHGRRMSLPARRYF